MHTGLRITSTRFLTRLILRRDTYPCAIAAYGCGSTLCSLIYKRNVARVARLLCHRDTFPRFTQQPRTLIGEQTDSGIDRSERSINHRVVESAKRAASPLNLPRWERAIPRRADRAGSPGRCGQPSSSVRPSAGRESHKGPVYIGARSFAISFFFSVGSPASPAAPTPDSRDRENAARSCDLVE